MVPMRFTWQVMIENQNPNLKIPNKSKIQNPNRTRAVNEFESVLDAIPDDRPAHLYLDLCRTHEAEPPGEDFSPAIRLTEK